MAIHFTFKYAGVIKKDGHPAKGKPWYWVLRGGKPAEINGNKLAVFPSTKHPENLVMVDSKPQGDVSNVFKCTIEDIK